VGLNPGSKQTKLSQCNKTELKRCNRTGSVVTGHTNTKAEGFT